MAESNLSIIIDDQQLESLASTLESLKTSLSAFSDELRINNDSFKKLNNEIKTLNDQNARLLSQTAQSTEAFQRLGTEVNTTSRSMKDLGLQSLSATSGIVTITKASNQGSLALASVKGAAQGLAFNFAKPLVTAIRTAAVRLGALVRGLGIAGVAFAGLGAAVAAMVAGFTVLHGTFSIVALTTKSITDSVTRLSESLRIASQQANVTTGFYERLAAAAELTGGSAAGAGQALLTFSSFLSQAANGGERQIQVLESLGVSVEDLRNGTLSTEEAFSKFSEGFKNLETEGLKAGVAIEVFGTRGLELIELLEEGSEGIDTMSESARRLGAFMSDELVTATEVYNDQLTLFSLGFKGIYQEIAEATLPVFIELMDVFTRGGGVLDVIRNLVINNKNALRSMATDGIKFLILGFKLLMPFVQLGIRAFQALDFVFSGASIAANSFGLVVVEVAKIMGGAMVDGAKAVVEALDAVLAAFEETARSSPIVGERLGNLFAESRVQLNALANETLEASRRTVEAIGQEANADRARLAQQTNAHRARMRFYNELVQGIGRARDVLETFDVAESLMTARTQEGISVPVALQVVSAEAAVGAGVAGGVGGAGVTGGVGQRNASKEELQRIQQETEEATRGIKPALQEYLRMQENVYSESARLRREFSRDQNIEEDPTINVFRAIVTDPRIEQFNDLINQRREASERLDTIQDDIVSAEEEFTQELQRIARERQEALRTSQLYSSLVQQTLQELGGTGSLVVSPEQTRQVLDSLGITDEKIIRLQIRGGGGEDLSISGSYWTEGFESIQSFYLNINELVEESNRQVSEFQSTLEAASSEYTTRIKEHRQEVVDLMSISTQDAELEIALIQKFEDELLTALESSYRQRAELRREDEEDARSYFSSLVDTALERSKEQVSISEFQSTLPTLYSGIADPRFDRRSELMAVATSEYNTLEDAIDGATNALQRYEQRFLRVNNVSLPDYIAATKSAKEETRELFKADGLQLFQDSFATLGQTIGTALGGGFDEGLSDAEIAKKALFELLGSTLNALGATAIAQGTIALFGDPLTGMAPNIPRGTGLIAAGTAAIAVGSAFSAKASNIQAKQPTTNNPGALPASSSSSQSTTNVFIENRFGNRFDARELDRSANETFSRAARAGQ